MKIVTVSEYIFRRLHQLGCKSVHGVPGDFFLRALPHATNAGVKWIGNSNELCAGYAADGYARAFSHAQAQQKGQSRPRVGALFTTYGVGELSAMNAVAGAYAEHIPVVNIVGSITTKAWKARSSIRPVHHTLGDGRTEVYAEMFKNVTCAQADFHQYSSPAHAVQAYDEALEKCVASSKPIYVSLPCDMTESLVPAELLQQDLRLEAISKDNGVQQRVIDAVFGKLKSSQRPLIIVDSYCYPWDISTEINQLVDLLQIPAMCLGAGRGVIDDSNPFFQGTIVDPSGYPNSSDLVLYIGPLLSDTNSGAWTALPQCENNIYFHHDHIDVAGQVHSDISIKPLLQALINTIRTSPLHSSSAPPAQKSWPTTDLTTLNPSDPITQTPLWPLLTSTLQPSDTLLLANGTPLVGLRTSGPLPPSTQVIGSGLWNAIGSMLPMSQGIALAKRDHSIPGRTILWEGDGSFQVTCQAISDVIRYRLDVTVVVINNGGYTYERLLDFERKDREWNDMPRWEYKDSGMYFGGKAAVEEGYKIWGRKVGTWGELLEALEEEGFRCGKELVILEVVVGPDDVPESARPGLRGGEQALKTMV